MAHFSPKVTQSKRLMAHPVRRGPIGAVAGFLSPAESRRTAATFGDGKPRLGRRHRELAAVLALLVVATVISASVPGGWANSASSGGSSGGSAVTLDQFLADAGPTPTPTADPTATAPLVLPVPSPSPSPSVTPKPKPTPAPPYRYVALGDSLTAWPSGSPWPTRLDAKDARLQLVHNAGVPGDTTAQMLARFNKDVADYSPQVLFILGGTNDMSKGVPQATTIANLQAIIVAAKAKKMHIFLVTCPPIKYSNWARKIISLNAAILHLANSYRIVLIDIHTPLANSSGNYQAKYTVDGVHFTDLGAQTVANVMYSRIHRLGY
jgi:lysophospholipase L1-like esterase